MPADRNLEYELIDKGGSVKKHTAELQKLQTTGVAGTAAIAKGFIAAQVTMNTLVGLYRTATEFMKEAIKLANEQARVDATLTAALRARNQYTAEAYEAIHATAEEYERLVGIEDEISVAIAGEISALTELSSRALPDAIKATIQWANITGKDELTAVLDVAKAINGNAMAMKRLGFDIKNTGDAQQNLNKILDETAQGWAIAEAKANTFEGAVAMLVAQWKELKETIGEFVTNSPDIVMVLRDISDALAAVNLKLESGTGLAALFGDAFNQTILTIAKGLRLLVIVDTYAKQFGRGVGEALFQKPRKLRPGEGPASQDSILKTFLDELIINLTPTAESEFEKAAFMNINMPGRAGGGTIAAKAGRAKKLADIAALSLRFGEGRAAQLQPWSAWGYGSWNLIPTSFAPGAGGWRGGVPSPGVITGGGMGGWAGGPAYGAYSQRNLGAGGGVPWWQSQTAQYAATGIGGYMSGGIGGAIGALAGSVFGPLGSIAGGLLGGLFGKKKGRQEPTKTMAPIPVKVINFQDFGTAMLNVTKQSRAGLSSFGIDRVAEMRLATRGTGIR